MKTTIVIVRSTDKQTAKCIKYIKSMYDKPQFDILISDHASRFDNISSDFIILINDKIIPTTNCFEELINSINNNSKLDIVCGQIRNQDNSIYSSWLDIVNDEIVPIGSGCNIYTSKYRIIQNIPACSLTLAIIRTKTIQNKHIHLSGNSVYDDYVFTSQINNNNNIIHNPFAVGIRNDYGQFEITEPIKITDRYKSQYNNTSQRVLIIDDLIPDITRGAGYPRMCKFIDKLLNKPFKIQITQVSNSKPSAELIEYWGRKGVEVLYDINIQSYIANNKYSYIIVSRPTTMAKVYEYIDKCESRIIYDTEAIYSNRNDIFTIDDEIKLTKKSNIIIAVTPQDKSLLMKSGKPTFTLGTYFENQPSASTYTSRNGILFIGWATNNTPNEIALLEFINIFNKLSDIPLYIIGQVSEKIMRASIGKNILFHGKVGNVTQYYDMHRITISNHNIVAGLPYKTLESMAFGVPCIMSKEIADQIQYQYQDAISTSPEDMLIKLLNTYHSAKSWEKVRNEGLKFINNNYNVKKFDQTISTIFNTSGTRLI